jgi:hypothetical protein
MNQIATISEDQMPATYQRAKTALAECSTTDECKDWKDKALALAAYAKQANDDALLVMANRIKARAVHRAGELFNQIPPSTGHNLPNVEGRGASPFGREQAARDAGWSQDQRKQAQRIANIPRDDFERAVESDNPPTLTELAGRARKNPEAMRATSLLLGEAKQFAKFCETQDPTELVPALAEHEMAALLSHAQTIVEWLSKLAKEITK